MTEKAVRLILARFSRQYGERFIRAVDGRPAADPAQVLADWLEDLSDLDDDLGYSAAAEVRKSLPHPPTPADVMNAARALGWQSPSVWDKALALDRRADLPPTERHRRIRALFPASGHAMCFGFPDDPPLTWERADNHDELARWDGYYERAARLYEVTAERAAQLAQAEQSRVVAPIADSEEEMVLA